jgi:hypothetical protein
VKPGRGRRSTSSCACSTVIPTCWTRSV